MGKIFLISIFFIFLYDRVTGQTDTIFYEFPESVSVRIEKYVKDERISNANIHFFAMLDELDGSRYMISILERESANSKNSLLETEIIRKTNRIVRSNGILMPLITGADLDFAYLGDVPPRNGKKGRKRILMSNDGFSLIFDRIGKIYED